MNRLAILISLCVALGASSTVTAGGLYLPGYGTQAQPRAGAFVAKADDPSALFHNPAGLAKQRGTALHIGFNFVDFSQTVTREGTYEDDPVAGAHPWDGQEYGSVENGAKPALGIGSIAAIPLIAVSTDLGLGGKFMFGAGIIAAHGYPFRDAESDYVFADPNTPPPPTRYDVIEQDALSANFTVGGAYAINPVLSVGLTLAWGIAELKARKHVWGIRNYEESVAQDGEVIFDAKDNFVPGFGVGVLWSPAPAFELGASYRSASNIEAKGTTISQLGTGVGLGGDPDSIVPSDEVLCQEGGNAAAVRGCLSITLPQSASIGGRYVFRDGDVERADIELDVKWEDWSAGSDYIGVVDGKSLLLGTRLNEVVTRHGFRDTFSFRLGGAYNLPISENTLSIRGGVAYDTAAAPLEFTRMDLDGMARTTVGLGIGLAFSRFRVDLGGGAVIEGDRTVAACNPSFAEPGCDDNGMDRPVADRDAPDPEQPLQGPNNQTQSPYNGGLYSQGYLLFSLGLSASF